MILLILIGLLVLLVPAYLGVGAKVGRSRYTQLMRDYQNSPSPYIQETIDEYRAELRGILHESHCGLNYKYLKEEGCSCKHRAKYWDLRSKISQRVPKMLPKPEPQYSLLVTWPGVVVESYMKGGAKALPNYQLIKELEQLTKD